MKTKLVIRIRKVADLVEKAEGYPDRFYALGISPGTARRVIDFVRMSPCITPAIAEWLLRIQELPTADHQRNL